MRRAARAAGSWLEDRTGIGAFTSRLLAGTVERHGAWLRTTGMACLVLVLVEIVTGIALAAYYQPSPSAAYRSVQEIDSTAMGRFLRGMHHYASAALIVLALLTVVRMFFGAEYRRRRDLVWIAALLFLQFVLFFQLTGHLLPWDTNAVATTDVEAGFAGNVWGLGTAIKQFLLGGGSTGAATLVRWYAFHIALLPVLAILAVGLPLLLHRLRISRAEAAVEEPVEGEEAAPARPADPYYPVHMAREMMVALGVFLIVAGLAWTKAAPLEMAATAENLQGYTAFSEWYVLPMHALAVAPPFNQVRYEPLATFVIPGLLFTLLAALPFLERKSRERRRQSGTLVALGLAVIGVTAIGTLVVASHEAPAARKQADIIAAKMGKRAPKFDARLAARGKELYAKVQPACDLCHAINGKGGTSGPDLTRAARLNPDREWQIAHMADPQSKVPGSTMPAYGHLPKEDVRALAEYMLSLY